MLKLAYKHLTQKLTRTLIAISAVTIATTSLFVFLTLKSGIQQSTFEQQKRENPLTQITVRPKNEGLISVFTPKDNLLKDETIETIKKIEGVKKIHPEIQFVNFASLEASLLGFTMITDTMIFGVPYEFIQNEIESEEIWKRAAEPHPAILPRKILELYNFAIAIPQGIPTLTEENLIGKKLTLYPNHSNFFPSQNVKESLQIEVVGFSDKINLIGITMPFQTVENFNSRYANKSTGNYLELFVETESPDSTPLVAAKIEELGLATQYFHKNIREIEQKLAILNISLGTITGLILIVSALAIIATFLGSISERTREIGLMRAIGATKKDIRRLILTEAAIIGFISSFIGITTGLIIAKFLIPRMNFQVLTLIGISSENLLFIDLKTLITASAFGIFFCVAAAYLPALKATKVQPIKILT